MAVASTTAGALGRPGGINNTAYLFFVLALAFLFYITVKGDLAKWLGLLGLGGSARPAAAPSQSVGTPAAAPGLPALPATTASPQAGQPLNPFAYGAAYLGAALNSPAGQNPLAAPQGGTYDTGTFSGGGTAVSNYTGPTYIDTASGF